MRLKPCLLIVAMLAPFLGASGAPAEDKLRSFPERWQLQFFPEEMPDQRPLLTGTAWLQRGDMNILGASTDLVIRFPAGMDRRAEFIPFPPAGPRGEAENGISSVLFPVEFSRISHPNFSNDPITETTEKFRQSLLVGPCLEYGGHVRTVHVVEDKQLLLDAVVPVNSLQWYTVRIDLTGRPGPPGGRQRDSHFRVTEYLYEFGADPLQVDEGPLAIHYHSHDSREAKTTIAHFHRTFRKESPPKHIPGVRRISTGLTPLLFYSEFNVAVTDENHRDPFESEAFLPLTKQTEE
jgi:hypothetical protein